MRRIIAYNSDTLKPGKYKLKHGNSYLLLSGVDLRNIQTRTSTVLTLKRNFQKIFMSISTIRMQFHAYKRLGIASLIKRRGNQFEIKDGSIVIKTFPANEVEIFLKNEPAPFGNRLANHWQDMSVSRFPQASNQSGQPAAPSQGLTYWREKASPSAWGIYISLWERHN